MFKYRVALTSSAERELGQLPAQAISRIGARIDRLESVPRPQGCKKLRGGDNEWRIRVGNYRVIYEIDDKARTIDVTRIAHRREAYD